MDKTQLRQDGSDAHSEHTLVQLDYSIDEFPGLLKSILFGMQHVLVMFTAMVGAPLIVARLLNLSPEQSVTIVVASMLACGVGTIISAMGISFIGPRLPIVMGSFFVFIGPIVSTAKASSLATAMSAILIAAVVQFLISPLFGKLHRLFPPVVTGTILMVIGVCLMKLAINAAVGFNTPAFGQPTTLLLSFSMILLILLIGRFAKGMTKALSLLIAMIIGYALSAALGLVNVEAIANARWIATPSFMPYGDFIWPGFTSIAVMVVCFLCAAGETTGHTLAVARICGVEPSEARIRGAVSNDGLASGFSALFGGMPLTSYSQNIGAIAITGVGSRFVVAVGGVCLVLMALVPKLGAIIALIPGPVLGGALIFMFGMIASVGVIIIGKAMNSRRDAILFATSLGISVGITSAPANAFEVIPSVLRILLTDGIVMGIITAIMLNLFLPAEEEKADTAGKTTTFAAGLPSSVSVQTHSEPTV
jgi:uracil-xanthine permease